MKKRAAPLSYQSLHCTYLRSEVENGLKMERNAKEGQIRGLCLNRIRSAVHPIRSHRFFSRGSTQSFFCLRNFNRTIGPRSRLFLLRRAGVPIFVSGCAIQRDLRMIEGQPFAVGRLRKSFDRFPQ